MNVEDAVTFSGMGDKQVNIVLSLWHSISLI